MLTKWKVDCIWPVFSWMFVPQCCPLAGYKLSFKRYKHYLFEGVTLCAIT
jgi:hypothetical protein